MSTAFVYRHYFLRCPNNSHAIPLPRPNRAGTDGNLQEIDRDNRKAVFVCPYCGLASAYYGKGVQEHFLGTSDPFEAGECILVAVEVECDGESCGAQKVVHTIQGVATGTWRPKVSPKDWHFSESALCGAEHKLRLDPTKLLYQRRTDDPF
jgi:hypothetical protein